jgi:hypothetical protein
MKRKIKNKKEFDLLIIGIILFGIFFIFLVGVK